MARLLSNISGAVDKARGGARTVQERAGEFAEENALETKLVDVAITFIGASNLPKACPGLLCSIVCLADSQFRWT